MDNNLDPWSEAWTRVEIENWHGESEHCVRVCLCSSLVTLVQKLNCVQAVVMMQAATSDYKIKQSIAGQLLPATIIFPIQR